MNPSTNLTWTTVKYSVKRLVGFHHLRYLRIWSPVVRDALFIAYRASIAQFLCKVLCVAKVVACPLSATGFRLVTLRCFEVFCLVTGSDVMPDFYRSNKLL